MTPETEALGTTLRAAAHAGDSAAVITAWRQADAETRAGLAYYLPRAAVLCAELREGSATAALAAAFASRGYAPAETVYGEETAAAECLAFFFNGERRRLSDEDPSVEYAEAWQYVRRLPSLSVPDAERSVVDAEAFTTRNPKPHWGPVRRAIANRLGDLVFLGTGGDNRAHEPWHTAK